MLSAEPAGGAWAVAVRTASGQCLRFRVKADRRTLPDRSQFGFLWRSSPAVAGVVVGAVDGVWRGFVAARVSALVEFDAGHLFLLKSAFALLARFSPF